MRHNRAIGAYALGIITGSAITGAIILATPTAHADEYSFLSTVHQLGFTANGGDAMLLRNGFEVCTALSQPGVNGEDVAAQVYRHTGPSITMHDAENFVIAAVSELCPAFLPHGNSTSNGGQVA